MSNVYKAITSIIPSRLIYQNQIYSITEIDDNHVINKYEIYLNNDDRIEKLKIDCDHVNADPKTDEFCLPDELKERYLTKDLIKKLEIVMGTYNLNHGYYTPWSYIQYDNYDPIEHVIKQQKRDNSLIMKLFRFINSIRNLGVNVID